MIGGVHTLRSSTRVASFASVDIEENTRVGGFVRSWEGHSSGKRLGTRSTNLDVDTLHVELSTTLPVALVESEDLRAEDVFARGERRQLHGVLALLASVASGKELVDGPGLAIESVLPELGPGHGGASFASVDHDRSLVGLCRSQYEVVHPWKIEDIRRQ